MATDTGVFLPDEEEPQIPKKAPQSARANGDQANRAMTARAAHADPAKLSEQELKSEIIAAWKKHEELAKKDLAPMLYWLREKLRAQGARNDLTQDKDRGFGFWVEEHLDFSRRTADRWCEWYAVEAGLKPTSGQVSKSEDDSLYEDILDTHKGKQQIAFNCWVPTALHAQYQKALTRIQNKFGLKDKKEALVRGVIYAATVIDKGAAGRGSAKVVGDVSLRKPRSKNAGNMQLRKRVRAAHGKRKAGRNVPVLARATREMGQQQVLRSTNGHRGEGSAKAMRAAAGR
jgi:hypothetical protein